MKNKTVALIVIYNKNVEDSQAYQSLKNNNNIDIMIIDNSTISNNNSEFCNKHNLIYISNDGNIGLSKAYNKAIQLLKEKYDYQYIMLADDDTNFNEDYIDEIVSLEKKDYDLIIPKIIDINSRQIASPKVYNNISLLTHTYDGKEFKNIKAINTGLCIKLSVFDNFKYNEKNFLYFVDVDFFDNCVKKQHLNYVITNTNITQNFSQFETDRDFESYKNQILMRLQDSKNYNNWVVHNLYKLAFIMNLVLKTKNWKLLKLVFFN